MKPDRPRAIESGFPLLEAFDVFASRVALWTGRPLAFVLAVALIAGWAITGPLFGFSDTWQLMINTTTTIVTFLMVFLIQHAQRRDTLSLQIKLAELIVVMKGAENSLATAEDMSESYLEKLHETYRQGGTALQRNHKGRNSAQRDT